MAEPKMRPRKEPKAIVGFLVIFGVLALFLGFWQLNNYLKSPFILNLSLTNQNLISQLSRLNGNYASKLMDTDHDNLSDYDELNIYKTSPYLEDSDSDGIDDYTEVSKNSDPSCPEGRICTAQNYNQNVNLNNLLNAEDQAGQASLAQAIRQSLIASGVSEAELNSIDDQTLIQLYSDVINQNNSANTNLSLPANVNKDELLNYNVEQIKQVLISGGATEADLAQMSDQEIIAAWQQLINSL